MVRHENEQANKEAGSQGAGASWSQIPSAVDLRGMAAGNSSDTAVVASIRPEDSPRTGVPRNPSERGGAGREQARRGWPRWIGMDGSRDEVKGPWSGPLIGPNAGNRSSIRGGLRDRMYLH